MINIPQGGEIKALMNTIVKEEHEKKQKELLEKQREEALAKAFKDAGGEFIKVLGAREATRITRKALDRYLGYAEPSK